MQGASETSGDDSLSTTVQEGIENLLVMSGVKLRGRNRADCPQCHHMRTIAYTSETFFCHEASCGWKGNRITLAKVLGLLQRTSPAEYKRQRQVRERAHDLAERLYRQVRKRRFELLDELHVLNRLESCANDAGPDAESAWEKMSAVYSKRRPILAELVILENGRAADLIRFLAADPQTRAGWITEVINCGGLYDSGRRFIEIDL
jgi:hypothetical protein